MYHIADSAVWETIFLHLHHLESISLTCKRFRHLIQQTTFKARFWTHKYSPHLVFYKLEKQYPQQLTEEMCQALLAEGAYLPKFWVEDLCQRHLEGKERMPHSGYDFIISEGFKVYQENLQMPDTARRSSSMMIQILGSKNDAGVFFDCFQKETVQLEKLKEIVYKHHFVPGLLAWEASEEVLALWGMLYRLLWLDQKLALFLISYSGFTFNQGNQQIMVQFVLGEEATLDRYKALSELGFVLDGPPVIELILSRKFNILSSPSHVQMIKDIIDPIALNLYATLALEKLFTEARDEDLYIAERLIPQFNLTQMDVRSVLLMDPNDDLNWRRERQHNFLTKYGNAQKGMRDSLWQFIAGRYGLESPMSIACICDLIVGGSTTSRMSIEPIANRTSTSSEPRSSMIRKVSDFQKQLSPQSSSDDFHARELLNVIDHSTIFARPLILPSLARHILETKKVEGRHIMVMAGAEQKLLDRESADIDTSMLTLEKTKLNWSKEEWMEALRIFILEDRGWQRMLRLSKASPSNLWMPSLFGSEGSTKSAQQFYSSCRTLMIMLISPDASEREKMRDKFRGQITDNPVEFGTMFGLYSTVDTGPFREWHQSISRDSTQKRRPSILKSLFN